MRDELSELLEVLDDREHKIILMRFGFNSSNPSLQIPKNCPASDSRTVCERHVTGPKNNDAELVTPSCDGIRGAPQKEPPMTINKTEEPIHGACIPSGRLFASIPGFDGGVVSFRVYLEQLALALKVTKPALQLLVVHVLKRTKQLLASHWLVLLNPCQQIRLSALFHSFLPFACVTSRGHSAALENPTKRPIKVRSILQGRSMRLKSPPN
jgi:hypothetical protein